MDHEKGSHFDLMSLSLEADEPLHIVFKKLGRQQKNENLYARCARRGKGDLSTHIALWLLLNRLPALQHA